MPYHRTGGGSSGGGTASDITVNTTTITGGTPNSIVIENAGGKFDVLAGANNAIPFWGPTGVPSKDGTNFTWAGAAGKGLLLGAGTAASAVSAETITQARNYSAGATDYVSWAFTETSTNASDAYFKIKGGAAGATDRFLVDLNSVVRSYKNGIIAFAVNVSATDQAGIGRNGSVGGMNLWGGSTATADGSADGIVMTTGLGLPAGRVIGITSNTVNQAIDTAFSRIGPAIMALGNGGAADKSATLQLASVALGAGGASTGSAATVNEVAKTTTAIADNVATATFTVTIPNSAQSAAIKVRLSGSLGAGGAIGANEASGAAEYDISIARTAGVNAVATASVAYGAATSSVAGAAVMTIAAAVSAVSGAVGATNTFTINVTIHAVTGSSTNHTCLTYAAIQNANATGISIA